MQYELFVSECQNCESCSGVCGHGCPRYAYWDEPQSAGWDSPHYTGLSETEARRRASLNPGGDCARMVASADAR